MPWWAVLYFSLYITFCLWFMVNDLRDKSEPRSGIGLEAVADVCIVIAALSFWIPSLHRLPLPVLIAFVIVGGVLYLWQMVRALRKHVLQDPDFARGERVFVGLFGAGMSILVTAPSMFWAVSSVLSHGAST